MILQNRGKVKSFLVISGQWLVDSGQQPGKSLIKLFKVCGFLRQSLKSTSAEVETLSVLQTSGVPPTVWKE